MGVILDYGSSMPAPTTEKDFWNRVEIRKPDQCWLWDGPPNNSGYGTFGHLSRLRGAHCWAYIFTYPQQKEAPCYLHTCDVRLCCNPAHIVRGTKSDNSVDAWRKGRNFYQQNPEARPRGEIHANSVLTWKIIREIRKKYATGQYRQIDLAREYGSTQAGISQIVRGVAWRETGGSQ